MFWVFLWIPQMSTILESSSCLDTNKNKSSNLSLSAWDVIWFTLDAAFELTGQDRMKT